MYGNRITKSMKQAIDETARRRERQLAHNRTHNITPQSIQKSVTKLDHTALHARSPQGDPEALLQHPLSSPKEIHKHIAKLTAKMREAALELQFEEAATLRDEIRALEELHLQIG